MARKPVSYLAGSIVIGTVVGTLVGLLSAPKSGQDLRVNIRRRAVELTREVPGQIRALPGRGRDAIKRLARRKPATGDPQEAAVREAFEGQDAAAQSDEEV